MLRPAVAVVFLQCAHIKMRIEEEGKNRERERERKAHGDKNDGLVRKNPNRRFIYS